MRKQDLERLVEEHEERVAHANKRVSKAEAFTSDCQLELGKLRVEKSQIDNVNVRIFLSPSLREGTNTWTLQSRNRSKNSSWRQDRWATRRSQKINGGRRDSKVEQPTNQLQQSFKKTIK